MHDAFLTQYKLLLFDAALPQLRSASVSLHFAVSPSHILSGVVRTRNKMQRGTWLVELVSVTSRKLLPVTRVLRMSSCSSGNCTLWFVEARNKSSWPLSGRS